MVVSEIVITSDKNGSCSDNLLFRELWISAAHHLLRSRMTLTTGAATTARRRKLAAYANCRAYRVDYGLKVSFYGLKVSFYGLNTTLVLSKILS